MILKDEPTRQYADRAPNLRLPIGDDVNGVSILMDDDDLVRPNRDRSVETNMHGHGVYGPITPLVVHAALCMVTLLTRAK